MARRDIGGHQNNILTCIASVQAAAFTPGQAAYDAITHNVYLPDVGRTTAGVIRIHYNPAGDLGKGIMDPISVQSLIGTTVNRNAAGGCPQISSPKTGAKIPLVPDALAIGPDGNLYVGGMRDGAILRIKSPATFNPSLDSDCQNKIDVPILSADSRVTAGHTFGLGWIGHTLLGNDNIAPWVLFNADQCLTPANQNKICGAPAVSGAPLPTEVLAAFVPGPQAAGTTDAQYPNFPGNTWFVATFPTLTKISNVTSTSSMNVQTSFGGTFSFITGLTPDPLDLTNRTLYVGADPSQGSINGAASMWQVVEQAPDPAPPLAPVNVSGTNASTMNNALVTVNWVPQSNNQPITSYVVHTYVPSTIPGNPPTAEYRLDTVNPDPKSGSLATSITLPLDRPAHKFLSIPGCPPTGCPLFAATGYQFAVEAVAVPAAARSQHLAAWSRRS